MLCPGLQGAAQALSAARVGEGVQLYVVTMPLADAATACWPAASLEDRSMLECRTGGALTSVADLEAALRAGSPADGDGPTPAPSVVAIVGGGALAELTSAVTRAVEGRPVAALPPEVRVAVREGLVERRLGRPGSDAVVRLTIELPPEAHPTRTSLEVLWELLPGLLRAESPNLVARVEDRFGMLEVRHDSELWEGELRRLRLGLARLASSPGLEAAGVEAAAGRLAVRRHAELERHPEGARRIAELHLSGGAAAVREHLFGTSGVTLAAVQQAAASWLPQHPGVVEVTLPPRVLNPRFASPPEVVRLGNDLTAAVLERPSTPLAVLVARPVVVPDVDGTLSATVLARVAVELRRQSDPPGWIRVHSDPPQLELAAGAEELGRLAEALRQALAQVAGDDREVSGDDDDARGRALTLASHLLGLSELVSPTPAELLKPSNLALGVVAPDGETAVETLAKLLVERGAGRRTAASAIRVDNRTREAVAGTTSTLVVLAPIPPSLSEGAALVLESVLVERARSALAGVACEVLRPHVPGRPTLILAVTAEGPLEALERRLAKVWPQLIRPVKEADIGGVRRLVAQSWSAATSGASGQARRAAAVAAGAVRWRTPADLELEILTLQAEPLSAELAALGPYERLASCGAGVLPVPGPTAVGAPR